MEGLLLDEELKMSTSTGSGVTGAVVLAQRAVELVTEVVVFGGCLDLVRADDRARSAPELPSLQAIRTYF